MKKWIFVLVIFVPIVWAVGKFFADFDTPPRADRPNIILIIADDLGPQLGSYGDTIARTPNIDRLAKLGTQFDAGYVTTASCSASRGSILTGLYPHQHGMLGLSQFGTQRMHDGVPKLPNELKELGYMTAIIGKRHFEPSDQFEWDREEEDGKMVMSDRDVIGMNKIAMDFIDEDTDGRPFFLVVSYVDPHRGDSDDGVRYGPAKNIKFPRTKLGLPENATPASQIIPFPFLGVDSAEIREELADYYGAVDRLDIGVGDLVKQLEQRGLLEDALVIFVGDHGPDVTRGKIAIYESATRVPFVVKVPGANSGLKREELVSTVDIFPTILEVAGGDQSASGPGRSLLPLTQANTRIDWRRYLFTEFITHGRNHFYPRYAVRDARYKLIYNVLGGERENPLAPANYCNAWWESRKPEYLHTPIRAVYDRVENPPRIELYDLQADPYEWHNLADDPELATLRDVLFLEIENWRESTNDPLLDPIEFRKEELKGQPK